MKSMKANSKQLSAKSRAATTPMSLRSSQRCNNIRIDGIEEQQYETWVRCEEKIQKVIKTS